MNFHSSTPFSLASIRQELIRLEDSILFALIERAQFAHNPFVYAMDKEGASPETKTFLDKMLFEIESVHARYRRYTSPDEYPFSNPSSLPSPVLPVMEFPVFLHENSVNINHEIKMDYIHEIIPCITRENKQVDDGNYGSSVTRDIEVLQLLSRRIHFGKFVAEAKFTDPSLHETYVDLIKNKDREGILQLLTNISVEEKLLKRVKRKAEIYGQDILDSDEEAKSPNKTHLKIPLDIVSSIFKNYIIPRTKQVQVEYLLQRI